MTQAISPRTFEVRLPVIQHLADHTVIDWRTQDLSMFVGTPFRGGFDFASGSITGARLDGEHVVLTISQKGATPHE